MKATEISGKVEVITLTCCCRHHDLVNSFGMYLKI
jgi:hypothetical protein